MKKWCVILCVMFVFLFNNKSQGQVTELAQLILNVEKLAQFKQILSDLKKGYEILTGGYKTVRNLSEGNFSLHKTFLDGLKQVSPAVKKYYKVADIVAIQLSIVKEYKRSLHLARSSGQFTLEEIEYLVNVYTRLTDHSLRNLDDLLTIITAGDLRMSDDERLSGIDKIYDDVSDKLYFLRSFNSSAQVMALQRAKASGEISAVQKLYSDN